MHNPIKENIDESMIEELIESGRLIEAGFQVWRQLNIPDNVPQETVDILHRAFFTGALYVFNSWEIVISADATKQDEARIKLIAAELDQFRENPEPSAESILQYFLDGR